MPTPPLRPVLAVAAVALTAGMLAAFAGDEDSAGPERGAATLREVLADPARFLGEEVTVSGEVQDLRPEHGVFTIGDRIAPRENELFVLPFPGAGAAAPVRAGSVVRVRGTVRRVRTVPDSGDVLFEDEEDDALDEFEGEVGIDAIGIEIIDTDASAEAPG